MFTLDSMHYKFLGVEKLVGSKKKVIKPQVRSYLDAREYLNAVLEWRRQGEPGFSCAAWATELGFNSRSFLRLILTGQRSMTAASVETFVKGLKLTGVDAAYFRKLVDFSQAATQAEREDLMLELGKQSRNLGHEVRDSFRFLASRFVPRLLILLSWPDIEQNPQILAQLLGVESEEIKEWLASLEQQGLIVKEGEKNGHAFYRTSGQTFRVGDDLGNLALQSFHRRSLEEAARAMDLPKQTRWYQAVVMPLTAQEYAQVQEQTLNFMQSLLKRYLGGSPEPRRLYQLNLNLIPVSETIIRSQATAPLRSDADNEKDEL